jgi:PAS domain S-box-containing protein
VPESALQNKAIADNQVIGIVRVKNRMIVWCNETFARQFGYAVADLIGQPTRIFYPDDAAYAEFAQKAFPVVEAGGVYRDEIRQLRNDNTFGWYLLNVAQFAPGSEEQIGVWIDITEKKQFELALAKKQEHLQRAQHVARIGSWETDLVTNEMIWSDTMYTIYGLPRDGTPPTHEAVMAVVHPDDRGPSVNAYRLATETGQRLDFVQRLVVPGQVLKYVRVLGELRYDENGRRRCWVGTVQDITIPAMESRYHQMRETMNDIAFNASRAGRHAAGAAKKSEVASMIATTVAREAGSTLPIIAAMAAEIANESAKSASDAKSAAHAIAEMAKDASQLLGSDFVMQHSALTAADAENSVKSAAEAASMALAAAEIAKAIKK